MDHGEQCVTGNGISPMPKWSVECSASTEQFGFVGQRTTGKGLELSTIMGYYVTVTKSVYYIAPHLRSAVVLTRKMLVFVAIS